MKGYLMLLAAAIQTVCMALLFASIATTRYKEGAMMGMHYHGQFMACPKNGPPGCGNMPDMVMLEVSKVASAVQACLAMALAAYLSYFGLLIVLKKAHKYLTGEMHQNLYFSVVVLSWIQMMCGLLGPILCTWCMEDAMPDMDWGYSMYLHWIQVPFSLASFGVVLATPLLTDASEFDGGSEKFN